MFGKVNDFRIVLGIAIVTIVLGASPVRAATGVISKTPMSADSYCHERFPAIRGRTLGSKHPALKNPGTGDIIDFYGACNHNPVGKGEVSSQKDEQQHAREDDYSG
jgi:hypothetical protein